jgi:hypothetical protein
MIPNQHIVNRIWIYKKLDSINVICANLDNNCDVACSFLLNRIEKPCQSPHLPIPSRNCFIPRAFITGGGLRIISAQMVILNLGRMGAARDSSGLPG